MRIGSGGGALRGESERLPAHAYIYVSLGKERRGWPSVPVTGYHVPRMMDDRSQASPATIAARTRATVHPRHPWPEEPPSSPVLAYSTKRGTAYHARVEQFLDSNEARAIRGKVKLVFTSPPYPLNRKKKYGNLTGPQYVDWISKLAPRRATC